MATITIYRNTQKKIKNGNYPIQVRITHSGQRKYITIGMNGKGLNGNEITFNDAAGLFNKCEPNYKVKNGIIISKLSEAEKILDKFRVGDIPFSFELFEREFIKKSKKKQHTPVF